MCWAMCISKPQTLQTTCWIFARFDLKNGKFLIGFILNGEKMPPKQQRTDMPLEELREFIAFNIRTMEPKCNL